MIDELNITNLFSSNPLEIPSGHKNTRISYLVRTLTESLCMRHTRPWFRRSTLPATQNHDA